MFVLNVWGGIFRLVLAEDTACLNIMDIFVLLSMEQETSSRLSSLECVAVRCSSKSSSEADETKDIDAND